MQRKHGAPPVIKGERVVGTKTQEPRNDPAAPCSTKLGKKGEAPFSEEAAAPQSGSASPCLPQSLL
jgi:hypothetical protein